MTASEADCPARKSALGLTCNIDRRGKRARAIVGVILLLASGFSLYFAVTPTGAALLPIIVGACLAIGGLFCLFEAANGWCALRAMGVKTHL